MFQAPRPSLLSRLGRSLTRLFGTRSSPATATADRTRRPLPDSVATEWDPWDASDVLAQVVDELPQHIFVKDRDGRFVLVNRAKAAHHGLAPEQMLGLRNADLPSASHTEAKADADQDAQVCATGRPLMLHNVVARDARGHDLRHVVRKAPLRAPDGTIRGVIAIVMDAAEAAAPQAEPVESEAGLRGLAEATPYALFVAGEEDGEILYANTATRELFRLEDDPTRHSTTEFFANAQDREALLTRIREHGTLRNYEGLCRRSDGTTFWAMASTSQARFAGRAALITSIVDISRQKQAEVQARASERLLRTVFDAVPINLFVKDNQARYLMANQNFTDMIGCTEADLVGHTWEEVAERFGVEADPEPVDDGPVLRDGKTVVVEDYALAPAGSEPQYQHVVKAPLRDEASNVVGLVGATTGVTRRVRAEQELAESRRLLETLLHALPFSVFMRDPEGRYQIVNQAFCEGIGLPAERLLGRHHLDCLEDSGLELDPRVTGTWEVETDAEDRFEFPDLPVVRPDGRKEYWHYVRTVLNGERGAPRHVVGCIVDVTERVQAQQALRERERELELAQEIGGVGTWRRELATGTLTWSAGTFRVWGREPGNTAPNFEELVNAVHEEEREAFRRRRLEVLDPDNAGRIDDVSRVTWPDGSLHFIRNVGEVIHDTQGRPTALIGLTQDVTERVQAERILRENEARFRAIAEHLPFGLTILDAHTNRLLLANEGFRRDFHFDGPLEEFDIREHYADPQDRDEVLREYHAHGRYGPRETCFRRADGTQFWAYISGAQISYGGRSAFLSSWVDLSARKEAEAAAEAATEALRASEARFRNLFEGSLQGIVIHRERRPLYVNDAFYRLLGFETAEDVYALGSIDGIVAQGERERMREMSRDRLAGLPTPKIFETQLTHADGSEVHVLVASRVVDWRGESAIQSTVLDITERFRAEQALQESEARYRTVVESTLMGIAVHTADSHVFANEAQARMLGYPDVASYHARIEGGRLLHVAPKDREYVRAMEQALIAGEIDVAESDAEVIHQDGGRHHVHWQAHRVDWQGEPAVLFTLIDITDRKRAEDELRASRRLLEIVIDAIPMWVFAKDTRSDYFMVNQTMADFFEVDKEALLGLNTARLPVPEATQSKSVQDDRWVFEHRRTLDQPRVELQRPNGVPVPFHSVKIPLFDDDGQLIGVLGVNRDITQEERANAELQASRDLLQAVFDTIPHGLFVKDAQGRFIMVNRALAAKWDLEPRDMIGQRMALEEQAPSEDRELVLGSDQRVLDRGELVHIERERILPDGALHILASVRTPLRNAEGAVIGIVGVSEDVTEQRSAQKERERYQRVVSTILDHLPIILWATDRDGIITLSSGSGLFGQGLVSGSVEGKSIFEVYPDYPEFLEKVRECLSGYAVVHTHTTRGRTYERWMQPQFDASGAPAGVLGISLDVTEREESRQALEEARGVLQYVVNNSPIALYALDRDGRIVMAEGQGLHDLNTAPGEAVGGTLVELLGDRPDVVQLHQDVLSQERNIDTVLELGGNTWQVYAGPRHDARHRIVGTIGLAINVTEQVAARRRIEESERRFRALFEGSLQAILIHDQGRPVLANQSVCDLMGVANPEELLRVPDMYEFIPEEDRAAVRERVDSRLAGTDLPTILELRVRRRDGTLRNVMQLASVAEIDGKPMTQVTLMDVTELKRKEEALRASETLMATVIDTLPHWIHAKGTDLRMKLVNRAYADYYALPREDILGLTAKEVVERLGRPVVRATNESHDRQVLQTGRPYFGKALPARGPEGQELLMDVAKLPLLDHEGVCTGVVTIAEDVTERMQTIAELERFRTQLEDLVQERTEALRAAQAELVTKERLATLGLLTGVVSHELRNPLGTIRTTSFLVGEVVREAGLGLEEDLSRIERNIDRCDRIIEELLAYTRPPVQDPQPMRVDDLVVEVLTEMSVPAEIKIVRELHSEHTVRADRERIRRTLLNVIQNAMQAIIEQGGRNTGTVTITTRDEPDRAEICVEDDGPGIPEDLRERLFEPLFSTKGFGVGLGLPIVKQILEAHGGGIELHSDGHSGTRAVMWLPPEPPAKEGEA